MPSFQNSDPLHDPLLIFQAGIEHQPNVSNNGLIDGMDIDRQNPSSAEPIEQPIRHAVIEQNVTVEVCGSRFCIVPSLFHKVENLKWKKSNGIFRLNANPDVFEMILQYFLYNALPDTKTLSHRKATELLHLVAPLEPMAVLRLCEHIQSGLLNGNASTTRTNPSVGGISSTFLKRGLSSLSALSSRSTQVVPNTTRRTHSSITVGTDSAAVAAAPVNDNPPSAIPPSHTSMTTSSTNPPVDVVSAPKSNGIVVQDTNPFALLVDRNSTANINPFALLDNSNIPTSDNPFALLGDCMSSSNAGRTESFSIPKGVLNRERRSSVPTGQQYPTQIITFDSCDSSSSGGSTSKLTQFSHSFGHGVDSTIRDENANAGPQSFHLVPLNVLSPSTEVNFTGVPMEKSSYPYHPTVLPSTSTFGVQDRNIPHNHTFQLPQCRPTIPSTQDESPEMVVDVKHGDGMSSRHNIHSKNEMTKKSRKKDPPLPLHQRRSTKLFRAVLKGGGGGGTGDRNLRKMTHADWCSSEYVL